MNDAAGAKTVDLAEAADFALGSVSVHPSTREFANAASREILEPRVMQVLVALARRRDQVVSRDAPGDPFASMFYAGAHASVGRARDAMPHYQRALTLEPASPIFAFTYCLSLATWNVEHAVDMVRELRRTFPRSPEILLLNSIVLQRAGLADEALAHVQAANLAEMGISDEDAGVFRLINWFVTSQFEERMNGVRALLAANADGALWIGLCKFAAEFGAFDLAYQQLFEALDKSRPLTARGTRSVGLPRFIQSAGFFFCDGLALRRDPRFASLCARLGLVDYWTSSGHWPDCADEVPYDFRAECAKAAAELGKT